MLGSPFNCGGAAQTIPRPSGTCGHLLIRVANDDATNSVIISLRPGVTVDATHADLYLMGGEAVKIGIDSIPPSGVSILNTTNNPSIYWAVI